MVAEVVQRTIGLPQNDRLGLLVQPFLGAIVNRWGVDPDGLGG
jgi:hypothetical protein